MRILVCGAGKGIGKALANLAKQQCHEVTALSRHEDVMIGKYHQEIVVDLKNQESIRILQELAPYADAVVNTTGIHPGTFVDY